MSTYPTISPIQSVQEFYEQMRRKGESHLLAEALALRAAPRANTDREFFEGHCNGNQFAGDEATGDRLAKIAQSHGYQPSRNDVYISQLAKFPGDPAAFVPATGGRSHIKRVCEKRGWGCEGSVKTRKASRAPAQAVPLAEDIVQKTIKEQVAQDPGLARKPKAELREMVIAKHGKKG